MRLTRSSFDVFAVVGDGVFEVGPDQIPAVPAANPVGLTVAGDDPIRVSSADEGVPSEPAIEAVSSRPAVDPIIASTTVDIVVALPCADPIVAVKAVDPIGCIVPHKNVRLGGAVHPAWVREPALAAAVDSDRVQAD